jgi:hypothetical protein
MAKITPCVKEITHLVLLFLGKVRKFPGVKTTNKAIRKKNANNFIYNI